MFDKRFGFHVSVTHSLVKHHPAHSRYLRIPLNIFRSFLSINLNEYLMLFFAIDYCLINRHGMHLRILKPFNATKYSLQFQSKNFFGLNVAFGVCVFFSLSIIFAILMVLPPLPMVFDNDIYIDIQRMTSFTLSAYMR